MTIAGFPYRMFFFTVVVSICVALAPMAGQASNPSSGKGKRGHALVIGNSNYRSIASLSNPANDASDIAAALEQLGFDVTLRVDANHKTMEQEILHFGRKLLKERGLGLFYYAGHGIQVAGRNYLIPIDADIDSESDIKFETVDVGRILGKMEDAENGVNIIILDACRNNPFKSKFRGMKGGLAEMQAPTGSLLAYATAPGSVAMDGDGRNGLYTSKLLKYIKKEGLSIEECFKKVRIEVMAESGNKQVPWEYVSLTANFYFVSPESVQVVQQETNSSKSIEMLYWDSIKNSKDARLYQSYLEEFPEGSFAKLAKLYIDKYEKIKLPPTKAPIPEPPQPVAVKAPEPAAVKPPEPEPQSESHPQETELPSDQQIKIAFLPSKFKADNWGVATPSIQYESALNAIRSIKKLIMVHTYHEYEESTFQTVWKKASFFSNPSVDVEATKEYCQSLDTDLALLINSYPESGVNHIIDLYLVDTYAGKVLAHSKTTADYNQIPQIIANQVTDTLEAYLLRHASRVPQD